MPEQLVTAQYKTGKYIGELLEINDGNNTSLIKVLAVVTHPTQGDLHNPKQTDVALFHQRRALAQFEKAWMPSHTVKPYNEALPPYIDSLRAALATQMKELEENETEWAKQCIIQLKDLQNDYFN